MDKNAFNAFADASPGFQAWIRGSVDGTVDTADWTLRDDPAYRAGFKRGRRLREILTARRSA